MLVAEHRTAIVRFIVILLNVTTYWLWLAPTGLGLPPLAAAVSVVAVGYGIYDLLFQPYRHFPVMAMSAWTTLTDGVLITLWLHATGGFASPYYLLWYLSLVAVTFRYDWRAPLVAAAVYSVAYLGIVAAAAPLWVHGIDMAIRVSYIFLCGGLGALLARETTLAFEAKSRLAERIHEAESFRSLAEASKEALVVSSEGVVLECNRAYCELMGMTREELVGTTLLSLIEPDSRGATERHIADPTGALEVWRNGPRGRQLLRVEARTITYQGRPARFSSLRDVTHERESQQLALQNTLHLSLALEAGQIGTWDLNFTTGRTRRNERFDQIYGHDVPQADWTLDDFLDPVEPAQVEEVRQAFAEARRTGRLELDCRIRWRDGSLHWVALQGQLRFDEQGFPAGLVGIARESSAAHLAEQVRVEALETASRLKEWQAVSLLAAVVESSIDGILTKDLSGTITSWNPACEAIFGYAAHEAVGKSIAMLYPKDSAKEEAQILARISAGEPVRLRESKRLHKDGSTLWVSVSASPLRDAEGRVVGCAAIKRDITQARLAEKEQREARNRLAEFERLQQLDRFKTQFINTAAHELRTPLLPLRLQLDLMMTDPEHPPLPPQKQAMEVMQRNLDRLSALVEDLLMTARSQAGRLQLKTAPVDLVQVVREAQRTFETLAQARGIRFVVETGEHLSVVADGKRIEQVLANFLSNAFKFTPAGGEVRVTLDPVQDGAFLAVSDTGMGIAPEDRARLFQPFVQVHDASQVPQPGSGLGLYICRQLIELHGGSIGCESPGRDKGSTFWFTLPGIPFRPPPDAAKEWNSTP